MREGGVLYGCGNIEMTKGDRAEQIARVLCLLGAKIFFRRVAKVLSMFSCEE